MDQQSPDLRYPVGRYRSPATITDTHLQSWIDTISAFPNELSALTEGLSQEQKNQVYRPGGWTVKQVVHHCVDSHMNALIRFKLALTEDQPTIRPYYEDRWAELPDDLEDDLSDSLQLLSVLHRRWVLLLQYLSQDDLQRTYFHPDDNATVTLANAVGMYAWHCRHHLAHVHQALSKG